MASQIDTARDRIKQIEASLKIIRERFEQDKNDVERLGWLDVSDLGHVAASLREIRRFYN